MAESTANATGPHDHAARPHMSIAWPPDYAAIESLLSERWSLTEPIVLVRALGGLSGSEVFVADVVGNDFTGEGILKLSPSDPEEQHDEGARHQAAMKAAPKYAEEHIPELIDSIDAAGAHVFLSAIAGRGLEYITAWDNCRYTLQLATARQVARDLLEQWNPTPSLTHGRVSPQELLESWVGYRLGEETGRIGSFVREVCGFEPSEPTFIDRGEWYPNPLSFANGVVEPPRPSLLRAAMGNVHGDLNGKNVLVSTEPPIRSTYYLIDFATYRDDAFLFFDHAYFELSHLLHVRGDADPTRWKALLDSSGRFPHPMADAHLDGDDLGHDELIGALRHEVMEWIDREFPHRVPTLEGQYMLARVAVGLTFAHRRLSNATRRKAFLYAAANLRDYLKLFDVPWPKWGPPMHRPDDALNVASSPPTEGSPSPADAEEPSDAVRRRAANRTAFEVFRAQPLIAVLPFDNRSPEPEHAFFAEAITDELLIELSRIDWMMAISRDTAFAFKEEELSAVQVGRELGVPYVAEGSVRRRADSVRIAVALVETERGTQLWGERYDVALDQLYELEDEITTTIVAHIESTLKGSEEDRARRKPPSDLDAWDLAQRAMWHLRRASADDDQLATRYATEAIEVDPLFAIPHAVLAMVGSRLMRFQSEPATDELLADALEHARIAVDLDPSDGFTHGSLGRALLATGQTTLALAEFERFAELNPSSAAPHLLMASTLLMMGEFDESSRALDVSIALSPMDAYLGWEYVVKGFNEYALGDIDDAIESFRRGARRAESSGLAHIGLALATKARGDADRARQLLDQAWSIAGDGGFAGVLQLMHKAQFSIADRLRDELLAIGLDPELWPVGR